MPTTKGISSSFRPVSYTHLGPGQSTYVIVYSIYQEAFFNNRFGLACAESVILFFIILALTLVQFRLEKKVTY